MPISPISGLASTPATTGTVNTLIAAINDEFKLYATKADHDALAARVTALEKKVIPPDLSARVNAIEGNLVNMATTAQVQKERQESFEAQIGGRLTVVEAHGHTDYPPDLTDRVEALENLIVRSPVENPLPGPVAFEALPRPAGIDPDRPALVYDKATIYLGDMELHALRIGENRWRLFAKLNYIVLSTAEWTYDEIFEGTPDEVYRHALARLEELAELKPQHDAVHSRVVAMSEGAP